MSAKIVPSDMRRAESFNFDDVLSAIPSTYSQFSQTPQRGASTPLHEQARQYKTRLCVYKDKCPYGPERCYFAHSPEEVRTPSGRWWIPEYKTKPCRYSWDECPFAKDGRCQFAHSVEELKQIPRESRAKFKTRMCKYALSGSGCRHGELCSYAHSADELRGRMARRENVACLPCAPPPRPPSPTEGLVESLERLTALHAAGSISDAEFELLKLKLISSSPPLPARVTPEMPLACMPATGGL